MIPCCYDYNEELPLGNVASQTIEEVLRGKPYDIIREVHESKTFDRVPLCDNCDQLCDRPDAFVLSTNKLHEDRALDDILSSTNSNASFNMEEEK